MAQYVAWQRLDGRNAHETAWSLLTRLYREKVAPDLPEIQYSPLGKPDFAGGNWHFSISHSQNHAFCVLSDSPVGIDAEELRRRVSPRLADRILSPGEKAQFDAAADQNRALLTFWVLKEAAGKLTGQGIRFHTTHTDFMLIDSRVQEIDGCLVAILTQEENSHAF